MTAYLPRPALAAACTIVGCLMAIAGCAPQDAIRQYTVPKEGGGTVAVASEPQEMLAAIVPKETPWAFKFQAQPEKVEQYRQQFRELVNSLSFTEDGTPKWNLPEQWNEEEGNQFVYRAFRIKADPKLRVTISKLGLPFDPKDMDESNWQSFVLANVNRWRGQLQLNEQAWAEMSGDLEPIETLSAPKTPAYFVTLRGLSGDSSMGGPMSGGMGPMSGGPMSAAPTAGSTNAASPEPSSPALSKPSPSATAKDKLMVKLPEGWQEVPPLNIMAMRSYEVTGADGKKAAITFIAAGGDRVSNVDRWSGQIRGAPEQTAKALEASDKLTVNEVPTEVFFLVGTGEPPQAITAAKIDWSSQDALFVKMMGPASVVTAQREAFLTMLKDLKW